MSLIGPINLQQMEAWILELIIGGRSEFNVTNKKLFIRGNIKSRFFRKFDDNNSLPPRTILPLKIYSASTSVEEERALLGRNSYEDMKST